MEGCQDAGPCDDLPAALEPLEVAEFLRPYGFIASDKVSWGRAQSPELTIQVTSHSTVGKHTYYTVECALSRVDRAGEKHCWKAARRLAHLREGLHDPLKRALGSSYQTYFCGVHFAHHLRPSGTTSRLDAWCRRLAHCITAKLAPPEIAAATLRVLGAPCIDVQGSDAGAAEAPPVPAIKSPAAAAKAMSLGVASPVRTASRPWPVAEPAAHVGGTMNGIPGSCGTVGVGNAVTSFDFRRQGGDDGDCASLDPDKDTLASEGASASTADIGPGGLMASFHPSSHCVTTSPGGASNWSDNSDDSGEDGDSDAIDDEELAEAMCTKVSEPLGFDPYCGRRRQTPLQ